MQDPACHGTHLAPSVSSAVRYQENRLSPHVTMLAPLLVAVMSGLLIWLTLGREPDSKPVAQHKTCSDCGSKVLEDWRLCPDCGEFIEPPVESRVSASGDGRAAESDSRLSF